MKLTKLGSTRRYGISQGDAQELATKARKALPTKQGDAIVVYVPTKPGSLDRPAHLTRYNYSVGDDPTWKYLITYW